MMLILKSLAVVEFTIGSSFRVRFGPKLQPGPQLRGAKPPLAAILPPEVF